MPRPKLSLDEIRHIDVCVALNSKEHAFIKQRAKASNKRIAEFLRSAGLSDKSLKIVPEVNAIAAQQIREFLYLLEQIALLIKEQQLPFPDPIMFAEMKKDLLQIHRDFLNYADD